MTETTAVPAPRAVPADTGPTDGGGPSPTPTPALLTPGEAARALTDAPVRLTRGFLGLDPVTRNTALLARQITDREIRVTRYDRALLGYTVNPLQPRQVMVATTSTDPAPLEALLDFLAVYQRATSFVAEVPDGSPVLTALEGCGFIPGGILRGHLFHTGRYRDVLVLHTDREG
ncbi:hypothetical protein FNQ90_18605 [Streptomyces alkaliphilus]|uniref:GNAT family N-acetyltransferase n=1 Tax=Streptomyces alkaliphilus TaxID=1472722 RepID=A0A7W3TFX2_9ACTN|nr:hypothetical protein [Streptomyces alkaliphilus]MBB0246061.1 hypothetical protein [Streptomyces alkaliphilus]